MYVTKVHADHVVERRVAASFHLPQTRDSGLCVEDAPKMPRSILVLRMNLPIRVTRGSFSSLAHAFAGFPGVPSDRSPSISFVTYSLWIRSSTLQRIDLNL